MNKSNQYNQIIKLLEANNANYELFTHEKVITSMDTVKALDHLDINNGAKSILFKTKDNFQLVVVRGSNLADYNKLRKHFDVRKIRLATPDEVLAIMGVEVGACYPFGSLAGVNMIVDESLAERDTIHFSPGTHYDHITMTYKDYAKIVQPRLVDIAKY